MAARGSHTGHMAVMTPQTRQVTTPPRRRPWLTLVVALLCAVPYAGGLLLPYYVNGVHHRPAGTTLYMYDLATLWPYDTAWGGVAAFVTGVGIPTVPFVAAGVATWSVFNLWDARSTLGPGQVVTYAVAALVAVASIAWLATPRGAELIMWFLD